MDVSEENDESRLRAGGHPREANRRQGNERNIRNKNETNRVPTGRRQTANPKQITKRSNPINAVPVNKFVPADAFFENLEWSPTGREGRIQPLFQLTPPPKSAEELDIENSFKISLKKRIGRSEFDADDSQHVSNVMRQNTAIPRMLHYDEPDEYDMARKEIDALGVPDDDRLFAEMDELIKVEHLYRNNADKTSAELANDFENVAKETDHLIQKALLEAERSKLRSNVIAHLAKTVQKTEEYKKFIRDYNERRGRPVMVEKSPDFKALKNLMYPDLLEPPQFIDYSETHGILDESIRETNLQEPLLQYQTAQNYRLQQNAKMLEDLVQADIDRDRNELEEDLPAEDNIASSSSSYNENLHQNLMYDQFQTPPQMTYRPKQHADYILDKSIETGFLIDPLIKAPLNLPPRADPELMQEDEMFFDDVFGADMVSTPIKPERFVKPQSTPPLDPEKERFYRDLASGKYRTDAYEDNIWSEGEPTLVGSSIISDINASCDALSNIGEPGFNESNYGRTIHLFSSDSEPKLIYSESDVSAPFGNESNIFDESQPNIPVSSESEAVQSPRNYTSRNRTPNRNQPYLTDDDLNQSYRYRDDIFNESAPEFVQSFVDDEPGYGPQIDHSIIAQGPSQLRNILEAGWQRTEDLEFMATQPQRDAFNISFKDPCPILNPNQYKQDVQSLAVQTDQPNDNNFDNLQISGNELLDDIGEPSFEKSASDDEPPLPPPPPSANANFGNFDITYNENLEDIEQPFLESIGSDISMASNYNLPYADSRGLPQSYPEHNFNENLHIPQDISDQDKYKLLTGMLNTKIDIVENGPHNSKMIGEIKKLQQEIEKMKKTNPNINEERSRHEEWENIDDEAPPSQAYEILDDKDRFITPPNRQMQGQTLAAPVKRYLPRVSDQRRIYQRNAVSPSYKKGLSPDYGPKQFYRRVEALIPSPNGDMNIPSDEQGFKWLDKMIAKMNVNSGHARTGMPEPTVSQIQMTYKQKIGNKNSGHPGKRLTTTTQFTSTLSKKPIDGRSQLPLASKRSQLTISRSQLHLKPQISNSQRPTTRGRTTQIPTTRGRTTQIPTTRSRTTQIPSTNNLLPKPTTKLSNTKLPESTRSQISVKSSRLQLPQKRSQLQPKQSGRNVQAPVTETRSKSQTVRSRTQVSVTQSRLRLPTQHRR